MATTKRTLQAPTLNNSGQITGGSSAPGGYLRKLPNELPGGDGPNSVRVIQTPQTNDSGNITGGNGVRTGTNTAEDPSTYNFTSITGVKQNTGNRVVVDGKEYILDGGARNATQNRTTTPSTTFKDNSAVLSTVGKTGTTNNLVGGRTDSLPGVTRYAGSDKVYGNNRAGIDLVNSQNELDNLSEAEKAQRLAGAYNPTPVPSNLPKGFTAPTSVDKGAGLSVVGYRDNPDGTTTNYLSDGTFETIGGTPAPTVATTQNPVVKRTLPKEETPVKPDIQAMDLPTIQENIDRLTYKVNSGKSLTEDEYVIYNQLKRQAIEMMKPQSLKGGFDDLKQQQQNDIATTQQTQEEQNAKDLEAFTKSQEAYKASQIAMIEKEENLSRQRMAAIFGATGQDSSTDTMSNFSEMEQNYALRKEAKLAEIQAKIDLFGSQQRKDSAETIQKMKDNLYNTQLKAAEYDVKDIEAVNAFNKEQSKSVLDSLDKLKAASDGIIASSTPLTEDQKKQAEVIANLIIDDKGNLDKTLLDSYGKTHPNLIPFATSLAVDLKKKAQENNLLMQGLDADIKKAQLNKLLNPDIDRKPTGETDANGNPIMYDPKNPTNTAVIPVAPTDIGGLSGADLAKTLASGKIDGKRFFGVYATGDPDGTQFASIYNKAANMGLDAYMQYWQGKGSKITADMVNQASIATGVDPITIAAKMAQDSGMGTQGKGARNNNPGNVGQFDSLDAKGITVKGYPTLKDGVLAVADNFKKRQDALLSVTPQRKQSGDINKIYQILTEAGQADGVAKNNAKTLASSGKTIEQIKQEYPNKDDQYRIRDVTDSVSKAYESFNKSNTKLDGIMRILKDPNASGKSIEVALKSFVSAIDNTAAMAGEVAQARDAGLSDIDALQSRLIKLGSGKVKESIRKDIENTISQFHAGIQGAYDDYLDTQQGSLKTQYGDMWADKLNLYKRGGQMQSTNTLKISPDRQ